MAQTLLGSLLVQGGTVVTNEKKFVADVFIEGEKIIAVAPDLRQKADRTVRANGCYVFPGGIDVHTHMELPLPTTTSSDTFASGTLAALHGGTTTIIDFANQAKGHSLGEALALWRRKADGKAVCDYGFHVSVTDVTPSTLSEIARCFEEGVSSFKTFLAYPNMRISTDEMRLLMREVKKRHGLITVHAEDGPEIEALIARNRKAGNLSPRFHAASHPASAEANAVRQIIKIGTQTSCPIYIVHLSTAAGLRYIAEAREDGAKAWAETCPQYLLLDDSKYSVKDWSGAARFVLSPPLRTKQDQAALWAGLHDGSIDVVATDHCPFFERQRELGREDFSRIPNGLPGVENRLELLYSEGVAKGRISLERFVEITATAPARIFGLYPRKGTLTPGADADLVIFDPSVESRISAKTHHMQCDHNPYEGWQIKGKCRTIILRGTVAIDDGKSFVGEGFGRYLSRDTPVLE